MAKLPSDIARRLQADFPHSHAEALEIVAALEFGPRVARCVVFLANGDLEELRHQARRASVDWREVIVSAEHDDDFDRPALRSMNEPFPEGS